MNFRGKSLSSFNRRNSINSKMKMFLLVWFQLWCVPIVRTDELVVVVVVVVPLVEFMYLVFTRMPGESYRR